jgi:hypothetical protein
MFVLQAKAEIYSYISRVETISYMESTLLGDPFDFLSNVPKLLARHVVFKRIFNT